MDDTASADGRTGAAILSCSVLVVGRSPEPQCPGPGGSGGSRPWRASGGPGGGAAGPGTRPAAPPNRRAGRPSDTGSAGDGVSGADRTGAPRPAAPKQQPRLSSDAVGHGPGMAVGSQGMTVGIGHGPVMVVGTRGMTVRET